LGGFGPAPPALAARRCVSPVRPVKGDASRRTVLQAQTGSWAGSHLGHRGALFNLTLVEISSVAATTCVGAQPGRCRESRLAARSDPTPGQSHLVWRQLMSVNPWFVSTCVVGRAGCNFARYRPSGVLALQIPLGAAGRAFVWCGPGLAFPLVFFVKVGESSSGSAAALPLRHKSRRTGPRIH
jgi:hypothetical protein